MQVLVLLVVLCCPEGYARGAEDAGDADQPPCAGDAKPASTGTADDTPCRGLGVAKDIGNGLGRVAADYMLAHTALT